MYATLMTTKSLDAISARIEEIKEELLALNVLRPGSLTVQYRDPKNKARPFLSLSYTHCMKSKTEYVRPEWEGEVRAQIQRYKRFKKLVETWVTLGIEYSRLAMRLDLRPIKREKP